MSTLWECRDCVGLEAWLEQRKKEAEASVSPVAMTTTTQRRVEVRRILRTAKGKKMTLRQVAEMTGVAPSTVMNIRRRMEWGQ